MIEHTGFQKNNRKQGPRDIIFKPTKYKDKDRIIKEARRLRPEGIYFKEDYTDRVKKIRWQLRELLQDARKLEGVQAFLSYDKLLVLKDNARNAYTYDLGKDCVVKLRDSFTDGLIIRAGAETENEQPQPAVDQGDENQR